MLIKSILDSNCGFENKGVDNPKLRLSARGIIENGDKIAILFKKNMNEYKLIGGGCDLGELPNETFYREALEETGSEIENIKFIGTTTEVKSHINFVQTSFVFVADFKSKKQDLTLTEKEIAEGSEFLWLDASEALRLMEKSLNNLKAGVDESEYSTKFVVVRDIEILKYYLKNKKTSKMLAK